LRTGLLGSIVGGSSKRWKTPAEREARLIALFVTASGFHLVLDRLGVLGFDCRRVSLPDLDSPRVARSSLEQKAR